MSIIAALDRPKRFLLLSIKGTGLIYDRVERKKHCNHTISAESLEIYNAHKSNDHNLCPLCQHAEPTHAPFLDSMIQTDPWLAIDIISKTHQPEIQELFEKEPTSQLINGIMQINWQKASYAITVEISELYLKNKVEKQQWDDYEKLKEWFRVKEAVDTPINNPNMIAWILGGFYHIRRVSEYLQRRRDANFIEWKRTGSNTFKIIASEHVIVISHLVGCNTRISPTSTNADFWYRDALIEIARYVPRNWKTIHANALRYFTDVCKKNDGIRLALLGR